MTPPGKGPEVFPFFCQLWWKSALVDLGYHMLHMIGELTDCSMRSYCVSSPFEWVLADDAEGVFLLWTGHMSV